MKVGEFVPGRGTAIIAEILLVGLLLGVQGLMYKFKDLYPVYTNEGPWTNDLMVFLGASFGGYLALRLVFPIVLFPMRLFVRKGLVGPSVHLTFLATVAAVVYFTFYARDSPLLIRAQEISGLYLGPVWTGILSKQLKGIDIQLALIGRIFAMLITLQVVFAVLFVPINVVVAIVSQITGPSQAKKRKVKRE